VAQKIAKLMVHIYNDAKRGTLSAWSFPSRQVAYLIVERLDLTSAHSSFSPTNEDLQYVTPHFHQKMLTTIARTDMKKFVTCLDNIIALSLRVGDAVDRQRVDNKHVMAKYVTKKSETETAYIGFSKSEEQGSTGLFHAMKQAVQKCGASWEDIYSRTTSIVTDGESSNTGQHHSLWVHLTAERQESEQKISRF
jgi:hypothetical protein